MCQPSPRLHSVIAQDTPTDGLAFDRLAKALTTIASHQSLSAAPRI
jgi:hypothetical protein